MDHGHLYIFQLVLFLILDAFIVSRTFINRREGKSQKAFFIFALVTTVLQLDTVILVLHEVDFIHLTNLPLYVLNVLLMCLFAGVGCSVFNWIRCISNPLVDEKRWGLDTILGALPVIILTGASVVSFHTHWVFYLDSNLCYQRGTLFFLQIVCPFAYIPLIVAYQLKVKFRSSVPLGHKSVRFLFLFVTPFLIGAVMQVLGHDPNAGFSQIGVSVGLLLTYMEMYVRDMEERKHVQELTNFNEKLRAANKQMRTLLMRGELQAKTVAEAIRGGFKISRNDKKISLKYVSTQLAAMLGYTVDELMQACGGNLMSIMNMEDYAREIASAQKKFRDGELSESHYRLRCKDGSWKYVVDRGRVIKADGSEDEIWSVMLDQDEIVKIENSMAAIEESRKKLSEYNEIISNAGLGVWNVTLADGKPGTMSGNAKLYELMGIPETKMSPLDIHDFMARRILPEDAPVFADAIEKMKKGQFAEALYRWMHPTKGVVYNRCGGTAVQLPDGSFSLSGYHGDATEIVANEQKQRKLLQEALSAAENSNRAKTAFLNNMSHDIRTPMNAILGFAKLMEKECDNPEKLQEHLRKLTGAGDFLLSLINNVLEMARIESGKIELDERPSILENNTEGTISIFSADLEKNHLTLTAGLDVQHNCVYVDMVKMREVLINLIGNAVKYSKEGGHISTMMREVPCSREGYAAYEFVVEDDGIGMSEDYLPHVFESFVRERNSTESKIAGTGLGLPIVKKLVDLMGGSIKVESKLGVGTKFTTYFEHRICTPEAYEASLNENVVEVKTLKGKRILLAEDNDLNAEIAETMLGDAGFIVERAEDGRICVDKLTAAAEDYYDIILMDVLMPNMNGYDATRAIRQLDNPRKDIPIVAMTANAFDEDRRNAFASGMNGHVAKPINLDVLLRTISNLLK